MGRLSRGHAFSLIELTVALALGLSVVAGLLSLFRIHAGVVRCQIQRTDVQQSLRIARHELTRMGRMAGRGGLPVGEAAVAVRNNVRPGRRIGGPGTPAVVPGTDVLVVRGVFEGPLYEVAPFDLELDGLTVHRRTAAGGVQELKPLADLALEGAGEALLVGAGPGSPRCAVVELTGGSGVRGDDGELAELRLESRAGGSELADAYRALAAACEPLAADEVRRLGVLEEYRFYLRNDGGPPGASSRHRLSRVRFYPGSQRVHPSSPRAGVAIVDFALDLQVALGIDRDGDGSVAEGSRNGRSSDEWLFNDAADPTVPASWPRDRLELIRVTLLLRGARPSRGPIAPALGRLEDRSYPEIDAPADLESRLFVRGRATATVRPRGG